MNRGAARRPIFRDDLDRHVFLNLIDGAVSKYEIKLHAYCLMGNHFHLLVRTPYPNLDRYMQHLCSQYVKLFNRRHGLDGPLCRSRYTAKPVESEVYAVTLARYIHRNPIDLGVTDLRTYRWSSYQAYLDVTVQPWWLETATLLRTVGGVSGLRMLVEDPQRTDVDELFKDGRVPDAIGSPEFIANVVADTANSRDDKQQPAATTSGTTSGTVSGTVPEVG